ncbi:hypothetical protein EN829_014905 [Mesorhizobium sp. M00.F.Ca.ET.186.01.1.1]|nr:hypothetical protein EN848_14530 [bacterium M00.F.Ca.ET.205.01.1.1]TGU52973.1 hypothetical protein EN795_14865 [bacterium M00.F.Ca.ET.152.01.1.1]TGV35942.1 hypothetical protein EN829_014905 [Mesorhizobium sp. M00.F.Ca.ET.186.01.1.1]TGZ43525.1 hypothetical protein EN805_10475 [bacterium M00.F.Ca.ET.162.01.1.1]
MHTERKMLPLAGHKHEKTQMFFRTFCECGWGSTANEKRRHAYSEWRDHIRSHGGEYESWEKAHAREDRAKAKQKAQIDLLFAGKGA